MRSDNERRGLCLSCKNSADCTYPMSPDRPVNQCDEFVLDRPAPPGTSGAKSSHAANPEEYG